MEIQHTPGPWAVDKAGFIYSLETAGLIAEIYTKHWTILEDERRANAHLIAATPGMLKALLAIQARLNGVWDAPALVGYGALMHDASVDIRRIVSLTLRDMSSASADPEISH